MRNMQMLALMMMAGCEGQVRDIKFPDAATSRAEQEGGMNKEPRSMGPERVPSEVFVPPIPGDAGHANPDAGHDLDSGFAEDAREKDAGAPSIDATSIDAVANDAGSQDAQEEGTGAMDVGSADAGSGQDSSATPDSGPPAGGAINELWTMAHGLLVIAEQSTRADSAPMPWWSRQAAVSAIFRAAGGRQYYLLVYERRPGEQLAAWMARAEVGDSALSARRLRTDNQMSGFVYETGDYGESPFVHVTVASAMYVYVFYTDDQTMEVPLDFVQFVESVSVQ